jgi:hypothetical protein
MVPDILFERCLFPVSFFSQFSHFHSLSLTITQRGSFSGLLLGFQAKVPRRAPEVLCSNDNKDDKGDDAHPVKRSRYSKGKDPVHAADRPPAAGLSTAGLSAASRCVCLRCSKRIRLKSTYPTPEGVMSVGHLCDSVVFQKYSYYATGHHSCDEVSLSSACLSFC